MPRAYTADIRNRVVFSVLGGESVDEVAQENNIGIRTIFRWLRHYDNSGDLANNYSNCGRRSDADTVNEIVQASIQDHFASAPKIRRDLQLSLGDHQIRKVLRDNGLRARHASKKIKLRQHHRHHRVNFATFYSDFQWDKCIFDDESCFTSEKDGIKFVRRPIGTRFDQEYANSTSHSERKTVSVWGAIANDGLGPIVKLDSALDRFTYAEIMDTYGKEMIREKFGSDQCYWISDNCRAHTSNLVKEWFESAHALHGIRVERILLPPYSPDLNLIENVWGNLKHDCLYADEPSSADQLWDIIQNFWNVRRSEPETCLSLFSSMPRRLDNVIRSDGFPTRY